MASREGCGSTNSDLFSLNFEKNKRSRDRGLGRTGGGGQEERYDVRAAPAEHEMNDLMIRVVPPRVGEIGHIGFVVWEGGLEKFRSIVPASFLSISLFFLLLSLENTLDSQTVNN